jgi:hypothetical protein
MLQLFAVCALLGVADSSVFSAARLVMIMQMKPRIGAGCLFSGHNIERGDLEYANEIVVHRVCRRALGIVRACRLRRHTRALRGSSAG